MSPVVASRRRFSSGRVLTFLFANLVWLAPLFLAPATMAAAATYTVTNTNDSGAGSLRDAITSANAADGNTVDASGVHGTINLASPLPSIVVGMTITGPGAGALTIDGGGVQNAFTVDMRANLGTNITVTISGFKVANTNATAANFGFGSGLFIYEDNTGQTVTVNVSGMIFSQANSASGGSAITNDGGQLNVDTSTFENNIATGNSGGAIYNNGGLSVTTSAFLSNIAGQGSAIYNTPAGGFGQPGTAVIRNSTFANNNSNGGLSNGAVLNIGTVTITNSTFSGNLPAAGGAIANGGTLTLANTILVDTAGGTACTGTGCPANPTNPADANGNLDDVAANLNLSSLGYHGGLTQTFVPQSGSPAGCKGKTSLDGGITTDQRGFTAPDSSCAAGSLDIGSVQLQPLVVTTTSDTSFGSCTAGGCTLRDAIDAANTAGSGDITFKSGVTGTITLATQETCTPLSDPTYHPSTAQYCIHSAVTITGPGTGSLTISGPVDPPGDRIFFIDHDGSLAISGVTLQNGDASRSLIDGGLAPAGQGLGGGAILNANQLTVDNVVFFNNNGGSYNGTGGRGGAIWATGASTTVSNSYFNGNIAGDAGGAIESSVGPLSVTNSTFYNNKSGTDANGSAIDDSSSVPVSITYSTFSNNATSGVGAGALFVGAGGILNLVNDTLANNSGGGVVNDTGTLTVKNTVLGESAECTDAACTGGSGNIIAPTNVNGVGYAGLSGLGNYGGPTQTILPLPGSTAICGGVVANIPSGVTTDQRGFANTAPGGYGCTAGTMDSGAVQTNYTAVAFNATAYTGSVGVAGSTPPMLVDFTESGNPIAAVPLGITTGGTAGAPSAGTTATTIATNGGFTGASFGGLTFGAQGTATVAENLVVHAADVIAAGPYNLVIGAGGTTAVVVTDAAPSAATVVNNVANAETLSATVTHTGTGVTEGYLTFTVCGGTYPTCTAVGTAIGPLAVNGSGTASTSYTIPANTTAGTYYILAHYTDPGGTYATTDGHNQTIVVNNPLAAAQALASPNAYTVASGVAVTPFTPVTATGGIPPYTFSITGTALPSALAITGTGGTAGQITGTPAAPSPLATYTVQVQDSQGTKATNTFELTVNASATTTAAVNQTATYSVAAQNVSLTATVTSTGTVNEGTVTFTLMKGATVIGTPVTSAALTTGTATVTYVVPAGTAAGAYTIQAAYNDTGGKFANSSDATHTLTIGTAAVTVAAVNQTAPYSAAAQNVTLTANITSTAGTVAEGTVTFTLKQGATTIGTPVTSATVAAGTTSVTYVVPAGQAAGSYTIQAVFNDTTPGNFATGSDATHTLTIGQTPVTVAAGNATTTYSGLNQNVTLTANITSTGGTVNEGTVVFTVKSGATTIGTPVTSATVAAGAASVTYVIPAGTAGGTYTISAAYSDTTGNFAAGSDTTHTLTISAAASTVAAVNATATYKSTAQNVTLTATVTSPAGTVNEGTVTFTVFNGATQVGAAVTSGAVTAGAATATFAIPAGQAPATYSIHATYNPATSFATSSDTTHTLVISQAAVTVAAVNATATYNAATQSVTLNATVTSTAGTVSEGTVLFTIKQGATVIGTAVTSPTVASGAATVSYPLPAGQAAGTYTIQADYTDTTGNYANGSDTAHTLTISGAATTVAAVNQTITYSGAAQNVTLTAAVTSTAGTVAEGTVTFTLKQGATTIGTAVTSTTVAAGAASVTYVVPAGTAAGSYTIQAVYNDAGGNYATGSDTAHTLTISQATATIAAADATTTYSGSTQNVTLHATVTSTAGTVSEGTVTFTILQGATVIGTATTSGTVASGAATATYALPAGQAAGSYTIKAVFNDAAGSFATATDTAHTLTIGNAVATVAAANVAAPFSVAAQNVTLTAAVTSTAGTVGQGTVTFTLMKGATAIGTPVTSTTVAAGAASVSYVIPAGQAAGAYTIQAVYNDAGGSFNSATDTTHTLTIGATATTIAAVNASAPYSGSTQNVTLTASVTSTAGAVNEGTVTFTVMKGATVVGTATTSTAVTAGAASVSYALPAGQASGSYTIQAVYNDATGNFATSTDTAHTLNIGQATPTLNAANATATYTTAAQNVTLTATVSSAAGAVNEGTVTFTVLQGATAIGAATTSGTVSAGAASVSYALPAGQATGTYTIQAVYNDAGGSFNTATDATHTLVIGTAFPTINWPTPSAITYGATLAGIVNGSGGPTATFNSNPITGTFAFTATLAGGAAVPVTASTVLGAGTYSLTATFTPSSTNYQTPAPVSVPLVVNQAQPTLAWTPPGTIAYGTSLAGVLTATANNSLAGSITYTATPAGGAVTASTILAAGTYTITATFTPTDATDYKTATQTAPLTVTGQTLTVTANDATKVYGTANPTFTGSITGAVNGDTFTESFTTSATATSDVGTYAIIPSAAGANLSSYTVAVNNGALTITQAGTTTTLTASGSSVNPGASVTLTATVASATTGMPTGTVTFYDGSTSLGTGTLMAGVATLSTSSLLSGSHTITAAYSGDSNFVASSTTSSVTVSVAALGLTMTANPNTRTGPAGDTFTYALSVAPAFAGTPYPGTVSFGATGGPAGAVITFSPSTLAANAGPQTVTMSVATPVKSAALQPNDTGRKLVPVALAFLLLPLAGTRRMRRNGQRLARFICLLLLALGGIAATTALTGCGSSTGGSNNNGNGTDYTITVTATSGSATQTTTVTLTVQ
jgi:CSLREA domain-containing protein